MAEEQGLITARNTNKPSKSKSTKIDSVGISIASINDAMRQTYGLDNDAEGVVITDIKQLSEAARKGLFEGDVIVEINQTPVTDPEAAKTVIAEALEKGRNSILLLINRDGDMALPGPKSQNR